MSSNERTLRWIVSILSFGLFFALYIIVLQDDFIDQNMYDLNVSQTAFMIQSHMIKTRGLCLPRLEIR